MEEWKDIPGYEGLYQISNMGNVKSIERTVRAYKKGLRTVHSKLISQSLTRDGYCSVSLSKNGKLKRFAVHRLVAKVFIPNPDNFPQVNHKDDNPQNNNSSNLEWCTNNFNQKWKICADRKSVSCDAQKVAEIIENNRLKYASICTIAKALGCDVTDILE